MTGNRDIIAIGASAGGIEALKDIVRDLPADLPAAVLVVVHVGDDGVHHLPTMLDRAGPLQALPAEDGRAIEPGHVIVARPGFHLLVDDGKVRLGHGPRENRARPAIDPLFRSVAAACGSRAIGVVLSGYLNDGTSGLYAIKRCGGLAIVQHPSDAAAPGMPRSALENVAVDHVEPASRIGALLARLAREPAGPAVPTPADLRAEVAVAAQEAHASDEILRRDPPARITCPDCGGTLWQLDEGALTRFRCHVGHAFTAETMLEAQSTEVERALSVALRVLEERTALWQQMARESAERGNDRAAARMRETARTHIRDGAHIRRLLRAMASHAVPDTVPGDPMPEQPVFRP